MRNGLGLHMGTKSVLMSPPSCDDKGVIVKRAKATNTVLNEGQSSHDKNKLGTR